MKEYYNKPSTVSDELKLHISKFFIYDVSDGTISRTDRKNSTGSLDRDGYLILKIKGVQIKAHRVAWFLHYGEFPLKEIDHIDRNRINNRISNLREASRLTNNRNIKQKINPDTGHIGIYKDKCTKGLKSVYATRIDGKTHRFRYLNDAVKLRIKNNKPI